MLVSRVSICVFNPSYGVFTHRRFKPVPLECLGLGSFKDPAENRREESESGSRLLHALTRPTKPTYPFTVFHKLDIKRRYTFYAQTEASRSKWYDTLVDAIGVRKAQLDANRVRNPQRLTCCSAL